MLIGLHICGAYIRQGGWLTIFPLISTAHAYYILKLSGSALIRGRRQLEGSAYFKVREMNSIKCQNLLIFSSKIRMKKFFTINKPNMTKSKYQQYFYCFNACILVPHAFWFSYQQNIVTILISAAFGDAALIRGEALIRGRCLFRCRHPKVRRL